MAGVRGGQTPPMEPLVVREDDLGAGLGEESGTPAGPLLTLCGPWGAWCPGVQAQGKLVAPGAQQEEGEAGGSLPGSPPAGPGDPTHTCGIPIPPSRARALLAVRLGQVARLNPDLIPYKSARASSMRLPF